MEVRESPLLGCVLDELSPGNSTYPDDTVSAVVLSPAVKKLVKVLMRNRPLLVSRQMTTGEPRAAASFVTQL